MKPSFPPIIIAVALVWLNICACAGMGSGQGAQGRSLEEIQLEKALALEKQGELHRALMAWRVAADLNPDNSLTPKMIAQLSETINTKVETQFEQGRRQLSKGDFEQARRSFLNVLHLDPDHGQALHYLKTELNAGERKRYEVQPGDSFSKIARDHYRDMSKAYAVAWFNGLDPEKPLLVNTRLILPELPSPPPPVTAEPAAPPDTAAEDRALARVIAKKREAEALKKALASLKAEDYQTALPILEDIVLQTPENMTARRLADQARYNWAKALIDQQKEAQAIELLNKLDKNYQDTGELLIQARARLNARAETYYRRGVRHFLNEELEAAIKNWKAALSLNPNHPKAASDMANAMRLLKKWQDLDQPAGDAPSPSNQ